MNSTEKDRILNMDINIHLLDKNTITGGFGGMEIPFLNKKPLIMKFDNLLLNDVIILSINEINSLENKISEYYKSNNKRTISLAKYLCDKNELIVTDLI